MPLFTSAENKQIRHCTISQCSIRVVSTHANSQRCHICKPQKVLEIFEDFLQTCDLLITYSDFTAGSFFNVLNNHVQRIMMLWMMSILFASGECTRLRDENASAAQYFSLETSVEVPILAGTATYIQLNASHLCSFSSRRIRFVDSRLQRG